jgi:hypothetical protein
VLDLNKRSSIVAQRRCEGWGESESYERRDTEKRFVDAGALQPGYCDMNKASR